MIDEACEKKGAMGKGLLCLLIFVMGNLLMGCVKAEDNVRSNVGPEREASLTANAKQKLQIYVEEAGKKLDPKVHDALQKIDGLARKLVAIRGYLRQGRNINSRWSWTEDEINRYKETTEYKAAMAEVEKVKSKFAELNPGYTLHVNREVRSLDVQLKSWNETKSVEAAGEELLTASLKEIDGPAYKDDPDEASLLKFQRFLQNFKLTRQPTLAVPGLSPHGQLRAFDFQVKQGNKIIAETNSATVEAAWDQAGWTKKLNEAITQASKKFTGPLESPREPWHYTYKP